MYPKYRLCEWLDTSQQALSRPDIPVVYGIQARLGPREPWMHCIHRGRPMLFPTKPEARAELELLEQR